MNFAGTKLGLTGSASALDAALEIKKTFTSNANMGASPGDAFPKGQKIDYDVTTGPAGSGHFAHHNALQIDYNQDSASIAADAHLYGTGLNIDMAAGTTGGQKITGINVSVTGSSDSGGVNDGNYGIVITAPPSHADGAPLSVRNMLSLIHI